MYYKAKKKFGQNFLKDQSYLNQIIKAIPHSQLQIVEIGVGLGDLTDRLLKEHSLIAYEVDRDLCSLLKNKYESLIASNRLQLIQGDVMELENQTAWLHPEPYFLVSNLPYYIATYIILKLLRDKMCKGLLVMTQKEVAKKFCANPMEKDFCPLSIMAQSVGKVDFLFEVPSSAFKPAPKVTSAVFRIIKSCNLPTLQGFQKLERLLQTAFIAPRKKLATNLLSSYSKQSTQEALRILQIKDNARPHEVPTSLYHQLLELLETLETKEK